MEIARFMILLQLPAANIENAPGSIPADMKKHNYPLHILLFLATVFTTLMAGAELRTASRFFEGDMGIGFADLHHGWLFSLAFLSFLTVHEFGHYLTAVYHRVSCSLPYYIPIYLPMQLFNIGSFGAVIRIREMPGSRRKYFDIGVAGPLAGFVVSLIILAIGFGNLPEWQVYLGELHPEYLSQGKIATLQEMVTRANGWPVPEVGTNLLYDGMASWLADPMRLPPGHEVMHYPLLFVGFLTLFFTALNLLPIGQLDGGHVIYGLFGQKVHGWVSRLAVLGLIFVGGTGLAYIPHYAPAQSGPFWSFLLDQGLKFSLYSGLLFLYFRKAFSDQGLGWQLLGAVALLSIQFGIKALFPGIESSGIWLLYAFLSVVMIGLDHPAAEDDTPLDLKRKLLGWLAIVIFILCFTFQPIQIH